MSLFGGQNPRFSPRDLPGLALWLDAADPLSFTLSGNNVTQWIDRSSNAYIGAASGNPVRTTVDGRTSVTFNGSTQFVDFGDVVDLGTAAMNIFMVCKFNLTTGNGSVFSKMAYASAQFRWVGAWREGGGMNTLVQPLNTGFGTGAGFTDTCTTARILTATWDRTRISIFENGTRRGFSDVSSTASFNSTHRLLVGAFASPAGGLPPTAGFYLNGSINEIICVLSSISPAQQQLVEGYLARKWAITSPALSSNPYTAYAIPTRTFTPLDIDGLTLWLDAGDRSTLGLVGSELFAWVDKSGRGLIAESNTNYPGVSRPTYASNYVQFDPSQAFVISNFPFTRPWSCIAAMNTVTQGERWMISPFNDVSLIPMGMSVTPLSNKIFPGLLPGAPGDACGARIEMTTASPYVWYRDGTALVSNPAVDISSATVRLGIGANATVAGSMRGTYRLHELLMYSNVLTDTQRALVEGYLTARWGLRGNFGATTFGRNAGSLTPVFTPTSISGCALWMDAADTPTLTLSGTNVTQWNDKSDRRYTFTVPAGGYTSPVYSNGILNMTGSNALWSTTNFEVSGNSPVTVFLVGSVTSIGNPGPGAHIGLAGAATPPQYFGVLAYQDANQTILYTPSCFGPDADQTLLPNISGRRYLLSAFYDRTVIQGTYNGTLSVSRSLTTANFAVRPFQIGMRNASPGSANSGTICECLCYTRALSSNERQRVEGYLAWKWGLARELASLQPYRTLKP